MVPVKIVGRSPAWWGGKEEKMLSWALIFLVVALIAALLGFGGIASASAGIAKVLFVIFLVLFLVSLFFGYGVAQVVGVP
jgi:uncharacterized membrane protein YtjA (UPF0391 family)